MLRNSVRFLKEKIFKNKFGHTLKSHDLKKGSILLQEKELTMKVLFMHVHKCAGTSLIETLANKSEYIACSSRPGDFPGRTGKEYIDDDLWNNLYKFSIIRNPYSRIVSAYRMFYKISYLKKIFPEFSDFVMMLKWSKLDLHEAQNSDPRTYKKKNSFWGIVHHCSSYSNPKYNLNNMNYIGKLETIKKDLDEIAKESKCEHIMLNVKKKNYGQYDYSTYYNNDTKKIISDIYAEDLERYNYKF